MSSEWEVPEGQESNRYTQVNYQQCKNDNLQSIEDGNGPIPEWSLNNRARESTNGVFGILTGRFDTYANAGPNAYWTQTEALAAVALPPWTTPEPPA